MAGPHGDDRPPHPLEAPPGRCSSSHDRPLPADGPALSSTTQSPDASETHTTRLASYFHELLEASPDALIIHDHDGRIVFANRRVTALFGHREEDLLGQPVEVLLPERFRALHRRHRAAYAVVPQPRQMGAGLELWGLRADGSEFAVEVSLSPIRTEQGLLIASAIRDCTERRQAEGERARLLADAEAARSAAQRARQEAEASRDQLAFLAETSAILAGSLDYEASLQQLAELAVPALADWCMVDVADEAGIIRRRAIASDDPAQTALLRAINDRYPPSRTSAHPSAVALRTGRPQITLQVSDADRQRLAENADHLALLRQLGDHARMTLPMIARGRTLGTISFCTRTRRYADRDVALAEEFARRAALAVDNAHLYTEGERARREAEAAVRLRDETLALVSHDLGQPLSAVRIGLFMLRQALSQSSDDVLHLLVELEAAATRMTAMTGELVDMARLQAGQSLDLHLRSTDLTALVRAEVTALRGSAARHSIQVCLPDEPVVGTWDAARLERVLSNLLHNAAKYSPDGGAIHVTVDWEAAGAGEWAVVTVADAGIGIPAADLPRLFTRFHRAGNVGDIPGSGLGLAGSRQIIEQHGGTIHVTSEEGHGTLVTVRLPLD